MGDEKWEAYWSDVDGNPVCEINEVGDGAVCEVFESPTWKRDAALISRAPDLLALVRELQTAIEGWAKENEVANGTCCWVSADSGVDHSDDCIRGHVDKPMRRLSELLKELG